MQGWTVLDLLGTDGKWRSLTPSQQLLSSTLVHTCVFSLLALALANGVRTFQLGERVSVLEVELVNSLPFASTSLESPSNSVAKLSEKIAPDTLQVSKSSESGLQVDRTKISLLSASNKLPANHGVYSVRTGSLKEGNGRGVARRSRGADPMNSKTAGQANANALITASSQTKALPLEQPTAQSNITNQIALAVTQAASFFVPQPSFRDLDSQACRAFMQGENIESSNPNKANEYYHKAIEIMAKAIPLLKLESGAESTNMAEALQNVGRCYIKLKDHDKAVAYFTDSADMFAKTAGAESLGRAIALVYRADELIQQHKFKEAEADLLFSLPIYVKNYGENSQYVAWTYRRLGNVCNNLQRWDDSSKWHEKAKEILAKST